MVLKFYRGSWCPICNRDLRSLQDILPQIKSLGASLLAVSPQNPDMAMDAKEKNSLEFRVLSDANQEVIRKYNLQFDPGEDYLKRRDLRLLNGDGSIFLPVPATFVIDRQAVIRAAHIDPNYTLRMKPEAILAALSDILENPGG